MNSWKTAGFVLSAGLLGSSVSTGAVFLYWKTEVPIPLGPVTLPITIRTMTKEHQVIDIPTKQYAYLGSYVFNTETIDSRGATVWATKWRRYDPNIRYKFVAPIGLEPGEFSVTLNIDYALNPVSRAKGTVKFLDLIVN